LSSYGRDLGVLLALREEFIDVFESRELQSRIANRLLPLPMLYAFQDANAKKEILSVVSRKRILSKDAETVVNIVMQTGPVNVLKSQMKERINKATALLNALHDPKVQRLRQLVRVVEEDL
jgi:geranylgeranyl pyrophosphate synthase